MTVPSQPDRVFTAVDRGLMLWVAGHKRDGHGVFVPTAPVTRGLESGSRPTRALAHRGSCCRSGAPPS